MFAVLTGSLESKKNANCLIKFNKIVARIESLNGSPLLPIYPEGREQREWRENRKSRQDGRFIRVVVISSDFPPVLFVQHRAGARSMTAARGVRRPFLYTTKNINC